VSVARIPSEEPDAAAAQPTTPASPDTPSTDTK
jgi:hypothetical protein